ncbi:hypothetical protein Purlil1_13225 [Purpureocillium lilacinum]|uniref:Uncharacterized protein n=1 Tax=Purpureocillium lilacinum TaxID=33203 RepID=A0ABR0BEM5_PURLI|nr:hypothetical protein Purlil1_13225 [Purpureocillium lilacinum]
MPSSPSLLDEAASGEGIAHRGVDSLDPTFPQTQPYTTCPDGGQTAESKDAAACSSFLLFGKLPPEIRIQNTGDDRVWHGDEGRKRHEELRRSGGRELDANCWMVVVIASGVAAEGGVVFKSASAVEVAHRASHVVFDKTGTLTEGKLRAVSESLLAQESGCLSMLLGLIIDSRHPVSVAVADYLKSKSIKPAAVSDAKSLTGKGIEALVGGRVLRGINSRWLNLLSEGAVQSVLANNLTTFCFTIDGVLAAVYGLEDSLRHNVKAVASDLQARGISVHIVLRDDRGAVQATAKKGKEPVVIFCGDGTNDAVALAQATIGVHMNEGCDMAKSAADVVLMRPDLPGIAVIMNHEQAVS